MHGCTSKTQMYIFTKKLTFTPNAQTLSLSVWCRYNTKTKVGYSRKNRMAL